MKKTEADIAVIGGGAAGMFAAARAADQGRRVVLMERNDGYTGKKLRITGKGRCNLTNDCTVETVLEHIRTNARFMISAINRFPPAAVMRYFESLGVALKTERGGRVFPQSDQALDVVHALRQAMQHAGVHVLYDRAQKIMENGTSVTAVCGERSEIDCRAVIVCTGGLSYPATGSTGDGYKLAADLGHSIVPPQPSLVPLCCRDACCAQMQGLSLRNVRLCVTNEKGTLLFSDFGEMLFTHFGVSGPLILSASAHMRKFDAEQYTLSIDLKPALDPEKLDARLLRDFKQFSNKDFSNYLPALVNHSMVPVILQRVQIPGDVKLHSVTRAQRAELLHLLKAFQLHVSGPRPIEEAIVTAGGVDVRQVSPSTMESKLVQGLYFAGEVLDVDAYTGGFNLQIAWSTAKAAADAAVAKIL
jgi:predicted Rossmann fold flavoprotein